MAKAKIIPTTAPDGARFSANDNHNPAATPITFHPRWREDRQTKRSRAPVTQTQAMLEGLLLGLDLKGLKRVRRWAEDCAARLLAAPCEDLRAEGAIYGALSRIVRAEIVYRKRGGR